jgi:hypothetical protein
MARRPPPPGPRGRQATRPLSSSRAATRHPRRRRARRGALLHLMDAGLAVVPIPDDGERVPACGEQEVELPDLEPLIGIKGLPALLLSDIIRRPQQLQDLPRRQVRVEGRDQGRTVVDGTHGKRKVAPVAQLKGVRGQRGRPLSQVLKRVVEDRPKRLDRSTSCPFPRQRPSRRRSGSPCAPSWPESSASCSRRIPGRAGAQPESPRS